MERHTVELIEKTLKAFHNAKLKEEETIEFETSGEEIITGNITFFDLIRSCWETVAFSGKVIMRHKYGSIEYNKSLLDTVRKIYGQMIDECGFYVLFI
jgi:hypothetical protein